MTAEDVTYFSPTAAGCAYFPDHSERYPLQIDDHSVLVEADSDVQVLATLTLPCSHSGEIHRFSSAISNPPVVWTDYPAVTVRSYGKGRVMYIAAEIENEVQDAQRNVFAGLIKGMLTAPPCVELDAPSWVEAVLYDDPEKNRILLYLLPAMEQWLDVEMGGVGVSVRTDKAVERVTDIRTGGNLPYIQKDGALSFTAEPAELFAMVAVEYM